MKNWYCKKCGDFICSFKPTKGQRRNVCDKCKKELYESKLAKPFDVKCLKCDIHLGTVNPKDFNGKVGTKKRICDSCRKLGRSEYLKKYRIKNPHKRREQYERHKEKVDKKQKEYYLKNKDKYAARAKQYAKEKPEIKKAATQRAKESGKGKQRSMEDRQKLKDFYVIKELSRQTGLSRNDILGCTDLIELKKQNILLKRALGKTTWKKKNNGSTL